MLISESWLREWVSPKINTQALADQLTMAGLEVDGIEPATIEFSGVVVGQIISVDPHPDADKLQICRVNIGANEALQIVCGAKNVQQGMLVPVATVGALLPNNFKIKKSKLRGQLSLGMICSASEIGLADSSDGIMPLPADAPVGKDIRDYLCLDDQCIELDLTPDRGDCLSIAGVAREVGVLNNLAVKSLKIKPVSANIEDKMTVEVINPEACPRYSCRIIKGVNNQIKTPCWMREKLRRSGLRSLGIIVDITNYVLIELGQPLHAFDLNKITAPIQVRMAEKGEKLALLNDDEITCNNDTLVIADKNNALALAGIMGGSASAVSNETTDILLESAYFNPLSITGKARFYSLHTDSSHRFERGVSPNLQLKAIERASALILEICGGRAGEITEVASQQHLPKTNRIELRRFQIERVLGVYIADDRVEEILERLNMTLEPNGEGWLVKVPLFRFDITIEVDLIEELGRIYGYEKIPTALPVSVDNMYIPPEASFNVYRAKCLLADLGYQEAITYTFISPALNKLFSMEKSAIPLANPISSEMSIMRTNLIAGLVQAMLHNKARQQERIWLFETGLSFIPKGDELIQENKLAGLITGTNNEQQWSLEQQKVDFYDLKGHLEALFQLTGCAEDFSFQEKTFDILHPGQSAAILMAGKEIGFMGLIHPEIEKKQQLPANTFVFELTINPLNNGKIAHFESLSKYPEIRRDLALTANISTSYNDIYQCIKAHSPKILQDISLFDVYTGEHVGNNQKSLALSLILQDKENTLTDEQVEKVSQQILGHLSEELSVHLRD